MLATASFGMYPHLLLNLANSTNNLTIYNSATSAYGLRVGLIWFSVGFVLMLAYVILMYRAFWGKVIPDHLNREY